jgi:hypothetical protein
MQELTRYWFEFDLTDDIPGIVRLGCGVTARTYADAIEIISNDIFKSNKLPVIKNCIENIDVRNLDQNHVIPNMLSPNNRGVWFPIGYQQ